MVVFRETKTITVTKCIMHFKIFNSVIKQSLYYKLLIQFYGNLSGQLCLPLVVIFNSLHTSSLQLIYSKTILGFQQLIVYLKHFSKEKTNIKNKTVTLFYNKLSNNSVLYIKVHL